MVNPAHEALFRQGLSEWNHWRTHNGSVTPQLSGVALSAADLRGADLSHACLRGATLIRSRLEGADLRYADLREAQLHEADLSDADLFRANLDGAFLCGTKLRRARLFGASLRRAQVTVADFRRADLREADLDNADLRESTGQGASFERANLKHATLSGCILVECNLKSTSGLTSRQVEAAILNDTTVLPESFQTRTPSSNSFDSLACELVRMKDRLTGQTVSETDVVCCHHLLARVAALGLPIDEARVAEAELVRAVSSSLARVSGDATNAIDPTADPTTAPSVDAAILRGRLEALLDQIRRRAS